MALTTDQLQAIDRHLRKDNWLLNEVLITELTDHYMTGIEDRMSTGVAFDVALKAVHTGFGGRKGLLSLEEKSNEQVMNWFYPEFKAILLSYARPPRLVLSLMMLTFACWVNQENKFMEWARTIHVILYGTLAFLAVSVFVWHGIRHVIGKRESIKPFTPLIYQLLTALNIPTIFNGLLAITSLRTSYVHYPILLQTVLTFGYLLIWVAIIESVGRVLSRFTRLLTSAR